MAPAGAVLHSPVPRPLPRRSACPLWALPPGGAPLAPAGAVLHSTVPWPVPRRGSATNCLGHFWRAGVGHFSRAPKRLTDSRVLEMRRNFSIAQVARPRRAASSQSRLVAWNEENGG